MWLPEIFKPSDIRQLSPKPGACAYIITFSRYLSGGGRRRSPCLAATLGLSGGEVAKGLGGVCRRAAAELLLQLGIQYQSPARCLSFKVISVENSLTAG